MDKQTEQLVLKVKGMTCVNCEHHIEQDLYGQDGIRKVNASFRKGTAVIEYSSFKITIEEIIMIISESGYAAEVFEEQESDKYSKINKILLGIISAMIGWTFLRRTGLLSLLNFFPEANENTSYLMLVVIGFLTSFHCIAMCGGINLSQCMKEEKNSLRPSILYNLGRIVSYTIIGGIVGTIGSVISFSGRMQGAVQLVAGVFMVIMGLNMLGVASWLRRFNLTMPKQITKMVSGKKGSNRPFIVGLANGLMPCGPLQSMQLYALSTGSMLSGALSMFLFSIGTVPLMFLLGVLSSVINKKSAGKIVKFGAILVVVLGASMFNNGLGLAGIGVSYGNTSEAVKAVIRDEVQEVTIDLKSGSYTPVIVEKGRKVRWTIRAEEGTLNGCNNKIIVREYGISQKLSLGETVIEFTPSEVGTVPYSCWMGMIRSSIYVVEPGEEVDIKQLERKKNEEAVVDYVIPTDEIAVAQVEGETQTVKVHMEDGRFTPAVVVLQEGIPTEWVIEVDQGVNGNLAIPIYGGVINLQKGKNALTLVPFRDFEIADESFSYYGIVKVVSDINSINIDTIKQEAKEYELTNGEAIDFLVPSCH
ncbi:MAG: sulfite exporter TauE/SafE family protein [bacterium]|nr:sulfite exporter TauE/SafE family protein [bacterium]